MPHRATPGSFKPGWKGGPGRPRKTPEQRMLEKAVEKAALSVTFDFKQECAKLLPIALAECAKIVKAKKGGPAAKVRITEMLADRLHGRPAQAITGANGGPLVISFAQLVASIDGGRTERFAERVEV